MSRTLPEDKPMPHFFSMAVTLEDLCYLGNLSVARSFQIGGIMNAILGNSEHHVRDGILIYAAGKLLEYGRDSASYLKEIYKKD